MVSQQAFDFTRQLASCQKVRLGDANFRVSVKIPVMEIHVIVIIDKIGSTRRSETTTLNAMSSSIKRNGIRSYNFRIEVSIY